MVRVSLIQHRIMKEPKSREYLPYLDKECELILPFNPKAGLYPGPDEDGFYLAEDIVARRQNPNGSWEFQIRWLGYDRRSDSWEPFGQLNEYLQRNVYERYTVQQGGRIDITPEQQQLIDSVIAETKRRTDERNGYLRKRGLPFDYYEMSDHSDDNSACISTSS